MKNTYEWEVRMPNYTYDMSSTIHLEEKLKKKDVKMTTVVISGWQNYYCLIKIT